MCIHSCFKGSFYYSAVAECIRVWPTSDFHTSLLVQVAFKWQHSELPLLCSWAYEQTCNGGSGVPVVLGAGV
jgi:hypothetical protein